MPELPEVETIVRSLRPSIIGRVISCAELLDRSLLRRPDRAGLGAVRGRRVVGVRRRGKMILIACDVGLTLVFHLKMTGQILIASGSDSPDKHTRLMLQFQDKKNALIFRDVRKFGFLLCLRAGPVNSCPEIADLGPEPFEVTAQELARRLGRRTAKIKSLLLDQSMIAGIGNIYADEILFDARIHPETPASALSPHAMGRLHKSTQNILTRAVAAKGSTLRDYVDARGQAGTFQFAHRVYDREGERCPVCRASIKRVRVAGRSSYFCPKCQRKRRAV